MNLMDSLLVFFVGCVAMLLFTVIVFDPIIHEAGARAVCESHGLELDSYEYIGSVPGYSKIRCWDSDPSSSVFRNVGGSE